MDKLCDKKKGSGAAIYFQENMTTERIDTLSFINKGIEILFVKLSLDENDIFVGIIYRPPNGNVQKFHDHFSETMSKFNKSDKICIMGDFNINLFENSSNTRPTVSVTTHYKPNCNKSCIDNIFLKKLDTENMCTTITTHISHHRSLFAIIDVKDKPKDSIIAPPKKFTHNYNDKNIGSLNKLLKHELNEQVPVNFETFTSILRDWIDRTCKLKNPKLSKRTKENNPWITQGLIYTISKRDCLYIKWCKTVGNRCKSGNPMLREQFRKYRNMLASFIKLGKQTYYKSRFTETNGDKKMWKLINNLCGKSVLKISSSFKIGNGTVNCKHKITNTFNEHFCSLAENINKQIPNNIDKRFTQYLPSPIESSIFFYKISINEITQIISQLKNGKSSDLLICIIKKN